MSGVYRITSLRDGTSYIGSTSRRFKERWQNHRNALTRGKHWLAHLQAAWNKYGADSFEFRIVEKTDDVTNREQYWLDRYRARGIRLYNKGTVVQTPTKGLNFSATHRARLRASRLGKKASPEARENMRQGQLGRVHSKESKEKRRKKMKGRKLSPESRAKQIAALKGRPVNPEQHARLLKNAESMALEYPSFRNEKTGQVIPSGRNMRAMCREYDLESSCMLRVAHGERHHHKGWIVVEGEA